MLFPEKSHNSKCVHLGVILKSLDQEHIFNMQPASAPTLSGCLELLEDFDVLNPVFHFWNKVWNIVLCIKICVFLRCKPSTRFWKMPVLWKQIRTLSEPLSLSETELLSVSLQKIVYLESKRFNSKNPDF